VPTQAVNDGKNLPISGQNLPADAVHECPYGRGTDWAGIRVTIRTSIANRMIPKEIGSAAPGALNA
jgi:hypothetical protein